MSNRANDLLFKLILVQCLSLDLSKKASGFFGKTPIDIPQKLLGTYN